MSIVRLPGDDAFLIREQRLVSQAAGKIAVKFLQEFDSGWLYGRVCVDKSETIAGLRWHTQLISKTKNDETLKPQSESGKLMRRTTCETGCVKNASCPAASGLGMDSDRKRLTLAIAIRRL